MEPLSMRLHKLALKQCWISDVSFLSLCFPELQELELQEVHFTSGKFEYLHRPFPKLVKIVLRNNNRLRSNDIAKIVEHNSQLKEIEIFDYRDFIRFHDILPSLAKHVPEIESLNVRLPHGNDFTPPYRSILADFRQLRKLSSVTLEFSSNTLAGNLVQDHILEGEIPLKHLSMVEAYLMGDPDRGWIEVVLPRLKQLETLKLLTMGGVAFSEILLCIQHCNELSTLHIWGRLSMDWEVPTLEDISQTVRNAKKLRSLSIRTMKRRS